MCAQPQPASRTPRRRQSWRHPAALALFAWAALALLPPPAAAQTPTVTITRDADDTVFIEGGEGAAKQASFSFRVNAIVPVEFSYEISGVQEGDITATRFRSGPQFLTDFNNRTTNILITAVDDSEAEGDETLTLTLRNPVNFESRDELSGDGSTATATLVDNDVELFITGPSSDVTEGGTATFTIGRSVATRTQVTVPYTVSGLEVGAFRHPGESTPSTSLSGSFVIPANQSSGDLVLTVLDNAVFEPAARTLTVTLSPEVSLALPSTTQGGTPTPVTRGTVSFRSGEDGTPQSSAQATILGDDVVLIEVSLVGADGRPAATVDVTEGSSFSLAFKLTADPLPPGRISIAFALEGEGVSNGDFRSAGPDGPVCLVDSAELSPHLFIPGFDPGAAAFSVGSTRSYPTCDDDRSEENEQVSFRFLEPIVQAPTPDAAVPSVRYRTADGRIVPTFSLTGLTLIDNDVLVAISPPEDALVSEGGTAIFTVTRVGDLRPEVMVPYTIGGAGIGVGDFRVAGEEPPRGLAPRVARIGASARSATIPLEILIDELPESAETLTVTIGGAGALRPTLSEGASGTLSIVTADGTASTASDASASASVIIPARAAVPTPTIADSDVGLALRGAAEFVVEGSTAEFVLTRDGDLDPAVVVTYVVEGGEGIDAADYRDLTGGSVELRRGATEARIRIQILEDDDDEEGEETLRVRVVSTSSDDLGPGGSIEVRPDSATVQISQLRIEVTLSGPEQVQEGAVARFAVSLAVEPAGRATTEEVVLAYTLGLSGDSATREADYEAPPGGSGTLRIPAGGVAGTIEVPVLRDRVREGEEEFSLALVPERSSGGGGAIRFAATRQTVRILDSTDEEEARREQRTRALLAATGRAAAHMATDVITARMSRGDIRAEASANANRKSSSDLEAADSSATLRARSRGLSSPAASASPEGERAQRGVGKRSRAKSCSGRERTAEASARCAPPSVRRSEEAPQARADRPGRAASRRRAKSDSPGKAFRRSPPPGRRTSEEAQTRRSHTVDVNAQRKLAPEALQPGREARSEGQLDGSPFASGSLRASAPPTRAPLATDALGTALRLTGLSPGSATPVGADGTMLQPDAALFAGIDAPVGAVATGPTAPGSDDAQPGASAAELRDSGPRLPRLAELLRGVDFELRGSELGWDRLGEGLGIWGAGTFTSLEGDPDVGDGRLDYEGESYGLFVGADQRLELGAADAGRELLVGAALGWTRADLDYRDRPSSGFAVEGRFRSELLAIHPYASLRLSPRARLWLLAGYGGGDVEIEERESLSGGDALRRVKTDATMWMVSAGAEGDVPLPGLGPASQLLVRVFGTRTSGSLDRARFDDDALLRGTRARTWRVAGELEGGHRFAFAEGAHFRPFVTARLRGDAGDDLGDDWELSVDLGGGAELAWPERGLSLGLRGTAQLNQGARHREHRVVVDLRYDLAGDGRGLTVEVENTLEGSGRLGARAEPGLGAAFSPGSYGGGGSLGALLQETTGEDLDAGAASALRHSIRGEIGYGLLAALPSWARGADGRERGLLTPYARFDLAAGSQATAAGLRFEAPGGTRLGVEAGVDFHRRRGHTDTAATPSPVYQFLLTGELEF